MFACIVCLRSVKGVCHINNYRVDHHTDTEVLSMNKTKASVSPTKINAARNLAHTFSIVYLAPKFVKLLELIRLGNVRQIFGSTQLSFVPTSTRFGLQSHSLQLSSPSLTPIRIKKLAPKTCFGMFPSNCEE